MENKGVDIAKLNMQLLMKIEELTLYIIQLKNENIELKEKTNMIDDLVERLNLLEKEIAE